ncbi:EamA/RhaT family transporter [Actinacidiphila acidipaludis]|uniref:EamA/RhaT family transporter n=1 Tax=Actinacidiphila acidipaludis TaxID=2873382 RepID=A0ABS7QAI0_9ACTN|nr:EamA/RhaT family transporter [Streptomyces acidipaludis]MBY8880163.1 EamA/RhaT family transporter [Streptomyces acidipaludis]
MSESTTPTAKATRAAGSAPRGDRRTTGPQPDPIRFFGTSWVEHDAGYRGRRVAVAAGSLAAALAGAFVLRFGFQGLADAKLNTLVMVLAVAGFAVCSALAFQRTWQSLTGAARGDVDSSRGLYAVGFVGALLAYFLRSLVEAPGEGVARAAYEAQLTPSARARRTP